MLKSNKLYLHRTWRFTQLCEILRSLPKVFYVGLCLFVARFLRLPGLLYGHYARHLGWYLCWVSGVKEGLPLLLHPVMATRFFEFDFVGRWLALDLQRALDVSSPNLFSLFQGYSGRVRLIDYVNPDITEKDVFLHLSDVLNISGKMKVETCGVEDLCGIPPVYDAVWSISVLEHIKNATVDDMAATKTLFSLVKPGGRLLLTVPTDTEYGEEYRDNDTYGTQKNRGEQGRYFFQRFYDQAAIQERIIAAVGILPTVVEWYGEKQAGRFHAYTKRWLRDGSSATLKDPYEFARHYKRYDSWEEMPGVGVCGLVFEKPLGDSC